MGHGRRVDAVVVLGCMVRDGRPSPALARRIELGLKVLRSEEASRLVASGGKAWDGAVEAEVIRSEVLREAPSVDVMMEARSRSTAENAYFTAELLASAGLRRVIVATCGWHLPRALENFRRCGVEALAPPASLVEGPPAGLVRVVRERLSTWRDARLLARLREIE